MKLVITKSNLGKNIQTESDWDWEWDWEAEH